MEEVMKTEEKNGLGKLSGRLRILAGALILLSGGIFLVQDYYSADSTRRLIYFMLMNFAVMFAGIVCAAVLKEPKGARTGLGAGLSLLPMYFLQVGAIAFVTFGSNVLKTYPGMLRFETLPSAFYGLIVAGSLAAFCALGLFAFRCLAGAKSLHMALAFALLNTAMLIPVRGNIIFTSLVCILETALLFYLEKRHFRKEAVLSSPEGIFSRGILFLPVILPAIREATLYSQAYLAQALALGVTAFVIAHIIAPNRADSEKILSVNSLIVSLAIYSFAKGLLINLNILSDFAPLLLFGLTGAYQYRVALLSPRYRKLHVNIGSLLITYGCYAEISIFNSPAVSTVMLVIGLLMAILGNTIQSKWTMLSALFISVFSGWEILYFIYNAKIFSSWMILGVSGIAILFLSSYLEKNTKRLQLKFNEIIKDWN